MIGVPNPHLFFRERQRCRAVSTACPDAQDGRETEDGPSRYVTDLSGWELPRTQALEDQLLEELVTKTRGRAPTPEVLGEELYGVFLSHLREIAGAAVNETIEYWLKGLAEGFNGTYPELCVEFSYLQHDECVDALTIDYCVDNQDGTRTRLHCTNVRTALMRHMDRFHERGGIKCGPTNVVAAELRALAHQLEGARTEHQKPVN